MSKELLLSTQKVSNHRNATIFLSDLKALLKGAVLFANVLPVLTGLWLAIYFTNSSVETYWEVILLTIIGSTLVMGGALILNNWYDADIDSKMTRTKHRPTVTGHFPLRIVFALGIVLSILGFFFLSFTTLEATVYAAVGWFTYVVLYTMWSKRKYTLNTAVGSISGAVTPLIGWAAIEPSAHYIPIILFLILFIWQMPHTFAIAIKNFDEYKKAGVAMLPIVRGLDRTKKQMLVYIACLIPLAIALKSLGITFVLIATLLNVGWYLIALSGFYTKNDEVWARSNFIYSVNYIMLLFGSMILVTLI